VTRRFLLALGLAMVAVCLVQMALDDPAATPSPTTVTEAPR